MNEFDPSQGREAIEKCRLDFEGDDSDRTPKPDCGSLYDNAEPIKIWLMTQGPSGLRRGPRIVLEQSGIEECGEESQRKPEIQMPDWHRRKK